MQITLETLQAIVEPDAPEYFLLPLSQELLFIFPATLLLIRDVKRGRMTRNWIKII